MFFFCHYILLVATQPLIGLVGSDAYHSQRGFKFHPVFIPLNQLLRAILEFRLRIADLLYRCALSHFIILTEYIPSTFDIHHSIFDIRFFIVSPDSTGRLFGRRQG
jgi:hypothetical protein